MSRLPYFLMVLAVWVLPPNRKAWGEAMRAEFEFLSGNKMGFAQGCFAGAIRENFTTVSGWSRLVLLSFAALIFKNSIRGMIRIAHTYLTDLDVSLWLAYFFNSLLAPLLPVIFYFVFGLLVLKTCTLITTPKRIADLANYWLCLLVVLQVGNILQVELAGHVFRYHPDDGTHWTGALPHMSIVVVGIIVATLGWRSAKHLSIAALAGSATIYFAGFKIPLYSEWIIKEVAKQAEPVITRSGEITYMSPSSLMGVCLLAFVIHCLQCWAEKRPLFRLKEWSAKL